MAAFEGAPNNVTLCGQSAGSTSTSCLMSMVSAKGLFHKVILESGIAHCPTQEKNHQVTKDIAKGLGAKPTAADFSRFTPEQCPQVGANA